GFQNLAAYGENRTVYYNTQGQMQYGQRKINGHWYNFERNTGTMSKGFTYLPDENKTVYYDQNGQMLYGVQKIGQDKYYFDVNSGTMKVDGLAYDKSNGTLGFYGKTGKQVSGIIKLEGKEFDFTDGALRVNGQQLVTLQEKTFLVNNSRVIVGQQKINNRWYYFDDDFGDMIRGFKYIADQKKTVYYDQSGQMQYGQQNINGAWYLFDKATGAMQTGFQYIADQYKTVYYMDNGQMVHGWKDIGGRRYFFDKATGAKASSEVLWIDGRAYAFDDQGRAHDFAELVQVINQLGSNIAVAIQSQKSGQIYSYSNSGDMRFWTASTVKVAVLAELLHNTGGNLTAHQRNLAEIMIRDSNNDATTNLINNHLHEAGSPANRLYRDLGMNATTIGPGWGRTLTTPTDQLKLLYQIFMTDNSSYLNRRSQDYIRHLMHTVNVNQRWGISAGSTDFYLKNGWVPSGYPWYVNSIGFIPNNGHGYTIAIYSYNNPFTVGINKVEQVARKVSQMLK
ncbi:MAG: hypothetical protein K2O72_00390, partial [Ligilactobacillus sp.]|nr:hypothetical protein [Ligilactobacillus sp.]